MGSGAASLEASAEPRRGPQPIRTWGARSVGIVLLAALCLASLSVSFAIRAENGPSPVADDGTLRCASGVRIPFLFDLMALASWLTLEALAIRACDGPGVPRLRRWLRRVMRLTILIAVFLAWLGDWAWLPSGMAGRTYCCGLRDLGA